MPVGLELYSVRGELAKDLLGTIAAVGKTGYEVVEFYAPILDWTVERAREVRKALDDAGLKCPSTHNNANAFTPEGLKKAIELNQIIGSHYIIMASAPRITSIDGWTTIAEQLTTVAAQLRPLRMATGFHNHLVEWKPLEGKRPMDVLAASTPRDVVMQFDVGTCLEAGEDPFAWVTAHPGRIKSVHCKDWTSAQGYNVPFGEGYAKWNELLDAIEKTGGVGTSSSSRRRASPTGVNCRWSSAAWRTGRSCAADALLDRPRVALIGAAVVRVPHAAIARLLESPLRRTALIFAGITRRPDAGVAGLLETPLHDGLTLVGARVLGVPHAPGSFLFVAPLLRRGTDAGEAGDGDGQRHRDPTSDPTMMVCHAAHHTSLCRASRSSRCRRTSGHSSARML